MVSFLNGFLCTCSCDVAKAKRGVDPHQQTDGAQSPTKPGATKNGIATPDKPAVVFSGSLSGSSTATDAAPSYAVQASVPTFQAQTVDLLV
jgi:hypothetical protein